MSSSGGSSGGVTSVFGRTGVVVAAAGDYTAAEVTHAADLSAALNTFAGAVEGANGLQTGANKFVFTDGITGNTTNNISLQSASFVDVTHISINATAPAPPANPLVSGTVYQNISGGAITIVQSVTATAATSMQVKLGSAAAPPNWGGAVTLASGAVGNFTLRVPNGWYYSFTGASLTFATAQIMGE